MRLILVFFALVSSSSSANIFFQTLEVKEVEVITPSKLELTISHRELSQDGVIALSIHSVDFGEAKELNCVNGVFHDCKRLKSFLSSRPLKVSLTGYNYQAAIYEGDVFAGGENLSHYMIKNGWYKFDYKQSRSKHLVIMQKEAMCRGLGIWAIPSQKIDEMCN